MTASSIKTRAATAAALLAMLPIGGALAQSAPTPLSAPRTEEVLISPNAQQPEGTQQPVSAPVSSQKSNDSFPEVTSPRDAKVQVQDLGAVDPGSTGVLTTGNGGFGADMWAGAQMAVVQKVMPSLPAATSSRTMRLLMRKLLLTAATVPAGKPVPGDNLVKLRADKLWAMGDADGLAAFLKGVPSQNFTPELRRLTAEAALLAGDSGLACDQLSALRSQPGDDAFAGKLGVFCQFAAGKGKEAALSLDVLREQKLNDPAFFIAADAMAGIAPGKLDAFNQLMPLTLAMARAAKIALPEAAAANAAHPAVLRGIALTPSATLEARLLAAEKAEAIGAIDTEVLRQAYDGVTFTPQELAAPVGADKGARGRAMLYRATVQQSLPNAKAELIGRAFAISGDYGPAYFTAARLYSVELQNIKPAPELVAFAYPAARALLAAGKPDAAKPWLMFLRNQMASAPETASAVSGLWPLLRMSAAEDDRMLPASALELWRKARADQPGEIGQRRAAICFSLLAALGEKLPEDAWLPLYDGPSQAATVGPRPALWQGLNNAVNDLRLGQTVLMSLATLGENGLAQADPSELYRVVAGLRHIGLDAEARALAVEAAIANGV
ncbi:MAG TPA: hypothetical protein VM661_07115 [Candidatus Sulfotelmatobacter sp.]|jgi:hypothetical protein|nr:hypothetical protein [Candidatus Sulfotelmatobacter sp.]